VPVGVSDLADERVRARVVDGERNRARGAGTARADEVAGGHVEDADVVRRRPDVHVRGRGQVREPARPLDRGVGGQGDRPGPRGARRSMSDPHGESYANEGAAPAEPGTPQQPRSRGPSAPPEPEFTFPERIGPLTDKTRPDMDDLQQSLTKAGVINAFAKKYED